MALFFIAAILILCAVMAGIAFRWRRRAAEEPRVLLTGGGTGGHVNPALAIAESIGQREPATRFLYVGVAGKAESVIVRRVGYPLKFVRSVGFPGFKPSPALIGFLVSLAVGMLQSLWILARFCPRWVISTGGYVSAPVVLTSVILRRLGISPVRVFLHEQNSVPGQLNSLMGRWADRVLLTFPQTRAFFPKNGSVVGYPVRHSIVLREKEEVLPTLDFEVPAGRKIVFVFGGSQGARTINRALIAALKILIAEKDRIFIIHGVGLAEASYYNAKNDTEKLLRESLSEEEQQILPNFYYCQQYFHNIADIYSISDLIVCRSGAGSLNEISRLGKPALLIPKSNLPGDHQVMNARAMKQAGAVEILFEETVFEGGETIEKVEGEVMAGRILRLLDDPEQLQRMSERSLQFLRRRTTERILSELYGDRHYDNGVSGAENAFRPLLSNQQLLRKLRAAYLKTPSHYDPLSVIGDADDLIYYRRRAEGLLAQPQWPERNLGVKLVGLTHYHEKIATLLQMLGDRTPAGPLTRLLGGDFEQVGFIRRNIVEAIQVLNKIDGTIEDALLKALSDPYYEVRAQVCRTVTHYGEFVAGKEYWLSALLGSLRDRSFEVIVEAAKALGEVGVDGRVLEALLMLKEHGQWQVRNGALHGILRLLQRRVICPTSELLLDVDHFILTAPDFKPAFSIQKTYEAISFCASNTEPSARDR